MVVAAENIFLQALKHQKWEGEQGQVDNCNKGGRQSPCRLDALLEHRPAGERDRQNVQERCLGQ